MPSVTTTAICRCCATCVTVNLQCRTRGAGTPATLCGYSEWGSHASTPPKKYRVLNMGGGYVFTGYTTNTCATPNGVDITCNWSGSCTYNAATCAVVTGAVQNCGGADASQCAAGSLGGDFAPDSADVNTTATRNEAKLTGTCRAGFPWGKYTTANQFAQLSIEDTEADAIARQEAALTWSAWSVCTVDASCCTAKYQPRTTTSFVHNEAQWRVYQTSLTANTLFYAHVPIYRRVYGTSPTWTLYQTIVTSGTTSVTGVLMIDGDVPNDVGYESYASQPCVVTRV